MEGFAAFDLRPEVLRALDEIGYEEPSPVQTQAIPLLLEGRDLIAQAMTGTGKTAAFGIPMVQRADPRQREPGALVLTPTRELAIQVAGELTRLARFRELCVLPIYGGQPYERQLRVLRQGVQILVATPGRLLDHLQRGTVRLDRVSFAVLDEADEMLNLGFIEDVEAILQAAPTERQTALFSATMPAPIVRLAARYLRDPARVTLSQPQALTVPAIEQFYYQVPRHHKVEALVRLLDTKAPTLALVFCATKRMVDELAEEVRARGYRTEALHGDMNQAQREKVIRAAREGRVEVLVATDVAARGLDIEQISHVVNFDLPHDAEAYVHRVGRTGRAGRAGEALSLLAPWERNQIRAIADATGAAIQRAEVPTVAEMETREREVVGERLLKTLTGGTWGGYRELVEELAEEHDPVDLAAAAIALAVGPRRELVEIPRVADLPPRAPRRLAERRPGPRGAFHERGPRAPFRDRSAYAERGPHGPARAHGPRDASERGARPDARPGGRPHRVRPPGDGSGRPRRPGR
jgi:ATP-dependent RNA helicase DeaD